ncbi:hypothetical protein SAMN05421874_12895 [Nonomuraea maritima]|uniref:Uncharacterized protein n=1 Tax=Nonomuraea maritima TaxID=683260 RepID=A0A1G9MNK8_9ACTN|nr:hypothetical protein [Nonomuraea maritima]SDL75235.1 hypothetical protein SAMN05421874_12895 [Nonomuraea maritima]
MAKGKLPEQQQPGEGQREFHERRRPWGAMVHAGTEVKTCRSRIGSAVEMLRGQLNGPSSYPIPVSQRARVEEWEQLLSRVLSDLEAVDVDAWKPQIREEITYRPEGQQ